VTTIRAWALALALGGAGGALFFLLDLPLPWMLGALSANTAAALSGLGPRVPRHLRTAMIAVLGLMLGSAFSPDLIGHVGHWAGSMAMLLGCGIVTTLVVVLYLRRTTDMSLVTAYFSGVPGGINEMVMTGTQLGGDERTIAMFHSLRILLIVFTIPFGYRLVAHAQASPITQTMGRLMDLAPADAALLAGCTIVGALAARAVRLPAWPLTGPLFLSALLHLAAVTQSRPPAELVILAQVVTGASIGARFRGMVWNDLARMARPVLGVTGLMLVVAAASAALMAETSSFPFPALLLSLVPGGMAEMCLVALALGQDVAFVSAHHLARVLMVILLAPPAYRLLRSRFSSTSP
jgi:membrane AbrB-like protein